MIAFWLYFGRMEKSGFKHSLFPGIRVFCAIKEVQGHRLIQYLKKYIVDVRRCK